MLKLKNVDHIRFYEDKICIAITMKDGLKGIMVLVDKQEMKFVLEDVAKILKIK